MPVLIFMPTTPRQNTVQINLGKTDTLKVQSQCFPLGLRRERKPI